MLKYRAFDELVSGLKSPVVLLEGTREVPPVDIPWLRAFGVWAATKYPHARFRSGNANGSDEAFAEGIKAVDASRLELLVPHVGHRQQNSAYPIETKALSELSTAAESNAADLTWNASPKYESMMTNRHKVPRVKIKANYLIRDTVKVTGSTEIGFAKASAGIFYVNTADPMKGGTGHTIRVCRELGVPVVFQDEWMGWMVPS